MKIDDRKWQKLLQAYRDKPANHKNASREAQCDRATARKAWTEGWPNANRRPIQTIMQEEEEARASMAAAKAEAIKTEMEAFATALRGDVRAQALEEYERTNRYLRAASATATATLVAAHKLMPTVQELAELAPTLVEMVHKDLGNGDMSAVQAVTLLERIAGFTKAVAAAANSATMQGAKVFEVTKARASMDSIVNIDKALNAEPFDPAEAKRLAAELAEAALEVEQFDPDGKPVLNVIAGEGGREEGETPEGAA